LCYNYIHKGGIKLATTKKKKPIHVNVDENLKEEAEQLFDDLGLNMTSAITIFLKQSINEQAIPFMINKGNKETLQALKDIKEGNVHGGFSSVEDLMEDLNA
jgi:DNA-damage-inducible protein J